MAVAVVLLLAAVLVVVPSSAPAEAATTAGWGQWDPLVGTGGAFTTTMRLPSAGFPATQVVTDSRAGQVGVISGASAWLAQGTPVGAKYGSSRDQPYLNLRPRADTAAAPSTTTYTFARPTPASGWAFTLGDIDADSVQVSARTRSGVTLTADQLGFRGGFNYCAPSVVGRPSCTGDPADVPTWNPATRTLTGNAAGLDTSGAAAWFEPTQPMITLTLTFTRRSGLPVYQTWFASLARDLSGTVTDVTPGAEGPAAGVTVDLYDADGALVGTTTTGVDGAYLFAGYTAAAGYVVEFKAPVGKITAGPNRRTASLESTDATGVDAQIRDIVPSAVSGTARDTDGAPVAGATVTLSGDGGDLTTITAADGSYLFDTVQPGTSSVSITAPDGYTVVGSPAPIVIPVGSEDPVTDQDFALAENPSLSGTVTANRTPVPGVVVTGTGPGGQTLVTTTDADGNYTLDRLAAGAWTIELTTPADYVPVGPTSRAADVAADDLIGVDFALAHTGTVSGVVTGPDATPVPGAVVLLDGPGGPRTAPTGTAGAYAFGGLTPGTYTASLTPPTGYTVAEPARQFVITPAGEVVLDQDFSLVAVATPDPSPSPPPADVPDPTDDAELAASGADVGSTAGIALLLIGGGIGLLAVRRRARQLPYRSFSTSPD